MNRSEVKAKLIESAKYSAEEIEEILDAVFGPEASTNADPGDDPDNDPPPQGNGGH